MENFVKGLFIGAGKILPGISGSMLAISLGVYKKMLYCVSNLHLLDRKQYKFLFEIGLGILISIFLLSKIILLIMDNYMLYIISIFLGFIIGASKKDITKNNLEIKKLFYIIIPLIIIFKLNILKFKLDINKISLIFLGLLEAFTMIIPGVSGTALFISLGVYDDVLKIISSAYNYQYLFYFVLGVSIGILLLSKIITSIINKNEGIFNLLSIGFTISTSSLIVINLITSNDFNFFNTFICLVLFIISLFLSLKLSNYHNI